MTTPSDPFASSPEPGSVPSPAPGTFSNAAAPPPVGGVPTWKPDSAAGLAKALIGLTAAVTGVFVLAAVLTPGYVADLKDREPTEIALHPVDLLFFLMIAILIAVYVVFALWVGRIRTSWRYRNVEPGGPPAVEWWGWFIPIASLILPYLGVRAINRGVARAGAVGLWWIFFVVFSLAWNIAQSVQFIAVDFFTGELTNPDALDGMIVPTYVAAVFLVGSWLFLAKAVKDITAYHDAQANA